MKNKTKGIVKKMREIRDKLSHEIMNMSFDEQKKYIKEQLTEIQMEKMQQTELHKSGGN